eukprot:GDKH01003196.1.p1 GENE.GDKH01003196.1~~GDKH01003196.1.p1  ORF type:complete len:125 (+),score=0.08 GDKH01003196.1:144-518(+)
MCSLGTRVSRLATSEGCRFGRQPLHTSAIRSFQVPIFVPEQAGDCTIGRWWCEVGDDVTRTQVLCDVKGKNGQLYTIASSHSGKLVAKQVPENGKIPTDARQICTIDAPLFGHLRSLWRDLGRK